MRSHCLQLAALAFGAAISIPPPSFANILEANMISLQVQMRGQLLAENTDYGSGTAFEGNRTDLRFARFLTLTGMMDETYGFQINTTSITSSTKTGSTGYGVSGQDVDSNDGNIRLHDGYFIANYYDWLKDRPHQDPPHPRQPRRLLRSAGHRPLRVHLQRLRHRPGQDQPRHRRHVLGSPRRQPRGLSGLGVPGARGRNPADPPVLARLRHLQPHAQRELHVRGSRALLVPR